MPLFLTPKIESLARAITGRAASLFAEDVAAAEEIIREKIHGARILIVGGAGSIGSATLRELLPYEPAALCVLDTNENNLAELVRHLRSGEQPLAAELLVEPLDYGSQLARRFLEQQPPFDLVLSFAALKHVRSERDVFSLLRMCEVNLLAADRFLHAVRAGGHGRSGVFFVSTDKAARPVSLMGATKKLMEALLWAHTRDGDAPGLPVATTTRFANVAFSDGSLPWGYLQRLEKRQPLAGPVDVRRYLVSPREAGQLCLLAATCAPSNHVVVPVMDPARHTVSFDRIAEIVLREQNLEPRWYDDKAEACAAVERDLAVSCYPVLRTRSDTSGEKDVEEFVGVGEHTVDLGLESVVGIPAAAVDEAGLRELLERLTDIHEGRASIPSKGELVEAFGRLVDDLAHSETDRSLDAKM